MLAWVFSGSTQPWYPQQPQAIPAPPAREPAPKARFKGKITDRLPYPGLIGFADAFFFFTLRVAHVIPHFPFVSHKPQPCIKVRWFQVAPLVLNSSIFARRPDGTYFSTGGQRRDHSEPEQINQSSCPILEALTYSPKRRAGHAALVFRASNLDSPSRRLFSPSLLPVAREIHRTARKPRKPRSSLRHHGRPRLGGQRVVAELLGCILGGAQPRPSHNFVVLCTLKEGHP